MKNTLLGLAVLGFMTTANAQTTGTPVMLDGMYILHLSPNGQYAGSQSGEITIYNISTGEKNVLEGELGLGNSISNTGLAVGDNLGIGYVIKNGVGKTPTALRRFSSSYINGISSDGSKIVGFLSNPEILNPSGDYTIGNLVPLIPFYAEIDEEGEIIGNLTLLPYPTKDFLGFRPQYVLANWISDDGKTILGQMADSYGRWYDPVVYKLGEDGKWTYDLPTKGLFNPEHVDISDNPWDLAPPVPNIQDFMSDQEWEYYQSDLWDYLLGEIEDVPVPEDYMNNNQIEAFNAAVEAYEEYLETHQKEIDEFEKVYRKILQTSPSFALNDLTLSRDGQSFAIVRTIEDYTLGEGIFKGELYLFNYTGLDEDADLAGYKLQIFDTPYPNLIPNQILSDGTLVATQGKTSITTNTYLVFPDSGGTYMSVEDYFESTHANWGNWMEKEIPNGNGVVCISEDWTTFTSALQPEHYAVLDENGTYSSIIFSSNNIYIGDSGVEELVTPTETGKFKVYNLQGVNILDTNKPDDLRNLEPGVYIVNGKKVMVRK